MKISAFILLLFGCGLLCGCHREARIPDDSYALAVTDVSKDSETEFIVSLLTIQVSRNATISIDYANGAHRSVQLSNAPDGVVRQGNVSLSAVRIAPPHEKYAYIQTLINPYTDYGAAAFGGAGVTKVPATTKLWDFFSISVDSGIYKLDTPLVIAHVHGQPVTMVVGKPTM